MIAATRASLTRTRQSVIRSGTQLVARTHSPIQQSIKSNTDVRLSLRMRFSPDEWMQAASFAAGYAWGLSLDRLSSIWNGKDTRKKMLVAIDAPLAEALLFEPVLRSLREHYRDRLLHLWATHEVCQLYSAAPYIAQLRVIEDRHDQTRLVTRRRQWRSHWDMGLGMGRHHYSLAIVDLLASKVARYCVVRGARTEAVCVLDHQGNARERMEPSGRLLRHMPFSNKSDPMDSLALLAEQWRGRILGDVPRIYPCDRAAQLAYSLARSWRSQAATLGATSIVGLAPCAHPPDETLMVGLRVWANTARELWSRHKAMPIIFAEGADPGAIDQLSSLLGEVPHAKLSSNIQVLERAGLLARLDLMIASAGGAAQLTAAQGIPSIIVGSPARKRLYAWVGSRSIYLHPGSTGRLETSDIMHAYRRLTMTPLPQRVAV